MAIWTILDSTGTLPEHVTEQLYFAGRSIDAVLYVTDQDELATVCRFFGVVAEPRVYTVESAEPIDYPELTHNYITHVSNCVYTTTNMELARSIIEGQGRTFYDDITSKLVERNGRRIVDFNHA